MWDTCPHTKAKKERAVLNGEPQTDERVSGRTHSGVGYILEQIVSYNLRQHRSEIQTMAAAYASTPVTTRCAITKY